MPEGDTIFRSARALHRALAGKPVTRFETAIAKLAVANDNRVIAGRMVEHVEARGKWLLMFFSGDLILLTHMLMNGSWHIYRVGERWRRARRDMRIVIETADWMAVGFTVPVAEFHSTASLQRKEQVVSLGPDLLRAEFREGDALNSIRSHAAEEIAVVLLNQRAIAGIGNVFKSEICFACRVHPFRHVESLTPTELDDIVHTSRKFLNANVPEDSNGERTTFTGARRTTNSLDREARLWVYGRRGEACRRCGAAILMRKQGTEARTTFWCPSCQPQDVAASVEPTHIEGWSYLRSGKMFF
jgi:endonuclease VIII